MTQNLDQLKDWIGRTTDVSDFISPTTIDGMAATLDRQDPGTRIGDPIPASWHWLFFNKAARQSELGDDGHPARGDFLPPVPLPRRMWAANETQFLRPLKVGTEISRHSTINNVSIKEGKSGTLVFVEVGHEISDPDGVAISEIQTLVYRGEPDPKAAPIAKPSPTDALWSRTITPDPVLLFRYSALTFIGHRIHYDRDYATQVEGYPALLVHGPLTATLLLDLCRREMPEAEVKKIQVRASGPLFDNAPFTLNGRPRKDGPGDGMVIDLWAADATGNLAMSITADIA